MSQSEKESQASSMSTKKKMTIEERVKHAPVLVDNTEQNGGIMRGFVDEKGMLHTLTVLQGTGLIAHSAGADAKSRDFLQRMFLEGIRRIVAGQGVRIA